MSSNVTLIMSFAIRSRNVEVEERQLGECPWCSFVFCDTQKFIGHLVKHKAAANKTRIYCCVCQLLFITAQEHRDHCESAHNNVGLYEITFGPGPRQTRTHSI